MRIGRVHTVVLLELANEDSVVKIGVAIRRGMTVQNATSNNKE